MTRNKFLLMCVLLCGGSAVHAQDVARQYIHDVITPTTTGLGVVQSSYESFSGKQAENGSDAVYAGKVRTPVYNEKQCFEITGGNFERNIVTTVSGGKAKSITVDWLDYSGNRTIEVWGTNEAYSAAETKTKGTKLISKQSAKKSAKYELNGDYKYLMLVSTGSSSACFYQLDIEWEYTYTRSVTQDSYGTICLPYDVPECNQDGTEYYEIAGTTLTDGEVDGIVLRSVDDLRAGTPYIFKASSNTLSATYANYKAKEAVPATGLVGNISDEKVEVPQGCYVLSNNEIRKLNGGKASIAANRAYLDLDGVEEYDPSTEPNEARVIRYGFDGSVEGFDAVAVRCAKAKCNEVVSVHSLDGKVQKTVGKGVNIVRMKNGTTKKVMVK